MGDPVELRHKEAEKRTPAISKLQDSISAANDFVASEDEKYAHIEAEDRKKVADAVVTAQTWLDENVAAQEAKPKTEPPVFMASAVESQTAAVSKVLRDVSSKPKPKPKEEPKPEPEKAEGDSSEKAEEQESKTAEGETPTETTDKAGDETEKPADMDVDVDVD